MTPLFFFGTLRHAPLLNAVLGDTSHLRLSAGDVSGFAVEAVPEGPFPTIVPRKGSTGTGVVVEGLRAADMARLDYYESAFGYALDDVVLCDGRGARAYLPPPGLFKGQGPWSFDTWIKDWSAMSVIAAREVMGYVGRKSPEDIARMFPMIRARAWSEVNAAQSTHGQDLFRGQVQIADRCRVYSDYFALDEFDVSHERFDGSMTDILKRAVFVTPDAAHVLPYDPVRDRVLVVEQMRMGPLARADVTRWQLEPVAGRLDAGETPETAARREAVEETGITVTTLHPVSQVYSSPGNSSEFHYMYVGMADLPDEAAGIGGLESEDENIRSHVIALDALISMCDAHEISNAPLILITYWLARHRDRLRAAS